MSLHIFDSDKTSRRQVFVFVSLINPMTKTIRARKETKKNADHPSKDAGQDGQAVKSIKAKANEKRSFTEIVIDRMIFVLGSHIFLFANVLVIIAWIIINSGLIPGIKPF